MDFNLEAPQSEVQPLRINMNPQLFKAATSGDKKILDELLQQKDSPLEVLVGETAIPIIEDATTQSDTNWLFGVTVEGNTALHIVASRGYLKLAEEICQRERSLLKASNTRLDTPLHCAARVGDDEMVSLIIQFVREDGIEARKVIGARNMKEANALHEAAQYDHVRVAEILMEQDAELASMLNGAGMSPLYLAIMTGSFNVAKALLQCSSWDNASLASYAGPNKKTALHVAVRVSPEITKEILQRKPMLAKGVDSAGRIPLHYAASDGHHDMVKLLLKHDPSTAYLSDADGLFPIHIAAIMGNIRAVDQILKWCPATQELLDKEGKNFLHAAFHATHELLDKEGKSFLHAHFRMTRLTLVKRIIRRRPDLRRLLNDQDHQGNTPLHTAVKNNNQSSVHFLLQEKTVHINVINHDGFTPLDLAYAKLEDKGLHFVVNAEDCIISCLALTKALFGPRELHKSRRVELSNHEAKEKPSEDEKCKKISSSHKDKEIKKEIDLSKNLGIASVLIATVTFAAVFTLPGGYIADDHPSHGTAVLAKEYPFKVFLISNAFAFVCSIIATCCLIYAGTSTVDRDTRMQTLYCAMNCLEVAFMGLSTAFAMGIYVVLASSHKRISIFLCIIVLGTPFLAHMVACGNAYSVATTIIIRQGYIQWICPTVDPYIRKRLGAGTIYLGHIFFLWLLCLLILQAIFFLLAML